MNLKQMAAERALEEVQSGMIVGLGTGSTTAYAISALGAALRDGRLQDVIGVPTSLRSERAAQEVGIPTRSLEDVDHVDLTIDGADEVDLDLNLIKGMGGALLREKLVAVNSQRVLIIVDVSKLVQQLGTKSALPVEIEPFDWRTHLPFLRSLSAEPILRQTPDNTPFVTDGGNYILDCRFSGIPDPYACQDALQSRPGIMEHGLFLGVASAVIVADEKSVYLKYAKEKDIS